MIVRADLLAILIIGIYGLAYLIYSKFLAEKVYLLSNKNKTPAHTLQDDIDYVPTRKHILFGHHFASIAGAAPIVGPCIAVYWGWVPALIWVVLGTIFMGAVHDMGTLFLSVRHEGKSMGSITGKIINERTKNIFLMIIFFLMWIIGAAFAVVIARLFVSHPGTVIPINIGIVLALIIGNLFYKKKVKPLIPSLIALTLLYAFIPVGVAYPIDLTQIFGLSIDGAIAAWVIFLMIYGFIASVLPVWVLLQPRDYINSHQLIVGLVVLLAGIFVSQPTIVAPEFNLNTPDAPPWFPFLFITIACGAISGAHGLIASGTTSKQINKETDVRAIGYGAMLIEGTLALLAIIAATAGFAKTSDWSAHYHSWEHASKHGLDAFIDGSASFLANLGIPTELGAVFIGVIIISFAATTLDTTFRIQRFIVHEIGDSAGLKFTKNRYLASGFAAATITLLIFSDSSRSVDGAFTLWPLFGACNQLVGSLSLLVLTLYLFQNNLAKNKKGMKKRYLIIAVPALLITIITFTSGYLSFDNFSHDKNYMLAGISLTLLILQAWVLTEGLLMFRKSKK